MSADGAGAHLRPQLRVGTSGWSYDHWSGIFYPEHLPAARRLNFYASHFSTVEIDATFYRLPSENAVRTWRAEVPEEFVFAVKGSRFITHFRKLTGVEDALQTFLDRVELLGEKLGVVLWQLPPTFQRDDVVLQHFLDQLPRDRVRHAVEFRHESWLADGVYELLSARGVAMVNVSGDMLRQDLTPTADFVYARFHGTSRYHGAYDRPALEPWAEFLGKQLAAGRDCFAYFNNDAEGHAPADAVRLMAMLERGQTNDARP
ncbi:MAG TPA: DUF72 domain-containing protein [Coriobacteriia bacterium]